jgi:hypothetical protein
MGGAFLREEEEGANRWIRESPPAYEVRPQAAGGLLPRLRLPLRSDKPR